MTAAAPALKCSAVAGSPDALAPGTSFTLTAHCCRHCGGRVLQAGDQYRCGGCGAVAMLDVSGICGCGILPGYRTGLRRFTCGRNPDRGPKSPSEIVVLFGETPVAAAA